jgi:hypothetical protein
MFQIEAVDVKRGTHFMKTLFSRYTVFAEINYKCLLQFDVHVTVYRDKFLIIKPTRCTNFSNLLLK